MVWVVVVAVPVDPVPCVKPAGPYSKSKLLPVDVKEKVKFVAVAEPAIKA
jgi:hypothetical protein